MADEIKIWAIDRSSGENKVTEVGTTGQAETERLLEDVLVEKPEMLMPGLALIGRQTLTAGGPLDLLGVDQSGQLVVFELKRGTLTREAVAQVVDYASYLESLNYMELVDFITQNSRELTVGIDDFDEWWADISSEDSPETPPLKPVQMVLVGLGVDERAERMVRYLAQQGAPLALLTFHGYVHGEQTFLAKQVEISPEVSAKAKASSGKE